MFNFSNGKKTVLVIDDDTSLQRQIRFHLEHRYENIEIKQALDGKNGLEIAHTEVPSLIILDWMLPDIEGPTILSSLKAEQNTKNIPVLMLSAKNKIGEIEEVFELDADSYITKPFSLQQLGEKVQELLEM